MLNATLVKRVNITNELVIFHIRPDAGVPEFIPGQYVALGLFGSSPRPKDYPEEKEIHQPDKLIKRAYSIGSSPKEKDYLEFYIAIVPTGILTSRMMCLKEGDRLFLAPKITGHFTVQEVPLDHNLILISTGTGIAPYMSMIRTESVWSLARKITVIHGVRYPKDLTYRDELLNLSKNHPNFSYYAMVSRDDPNWNGDRGHIQKYFKDGIINLNPAIDHVFMCGNPAMIEEMEKMLTEQGYTEHSKKHPGTLHVEKYW